MRGKAKTLSTDRYLAAMRNDKRAALEKLRKTIRAAAPRAEEYISYGLPASDALPTSAGSARTVTRSGADRVRQPGGGPFFVVAAC
jgi:hypothetical protein